MSEPVNREELRKQAREAHELMQRLPYYLVGRIPCYLYKQDVMADRTLPDGRRIVLVGFWFVRIVGIPGYPDVFGPYAGRALKNARGEWTVEIPQEIRGGSSEADLLLRRRIAKAAGIRYEGKPLLRIGGDESTTADRVFFD